MKRIILAVSSLILILAIVQLQFINSAFANPSIPPEIPPIVSVSRMNFNATISSFNNQVWAKVDVEYKTDTIYAFGDSYLLPKEFASPTDTSPYVKFTVVTDKLDADYPIPLDATNITVKVNNKETQWQMKDRSIYHLYGSDMPRIGWTIQPVQHGFTINVHYEHPLLKTSDDEYALIIPLGQRYSSTGAPGYPLYDWFGQGNPVASINVLTEQRINQMQAYTINNIGTLSPISYSNSMEGTATRAAMEFSKTEQTSFPFGAVIVMNAKPSQEPFPTFTLEAVALILVIIAGASGGLLIYGRRRRSGLMSTGLVIGVFYGFLVLI